MRNLTTIERLAIEREQLKMMRQSILEVLSARFGSNPSNLDGELEKIDALERLNQLLRQAAVTPSIAHFTEHLTTIES
jgi:hypothetical protein